MIRFHVLGKADLRDDAGRELRSVLAQPKRLALLTYLALEASGSFCRRDSLLALFWPDVETDRARLALRQALHFLRRTLGSSAISRRGDEEIGLAGDAIWCDAVAFQQAIAQGRTQEGIDLYNGELLPAFFISDASPDFDQWLDSQRARLRDRAVSAAWSLADAAERAGNLGEAVSRGRQALVYLPHDEGGVRRLIAMLDRAGDRAGALREYDSFVQHMRAEFDIQPAAETLALVDAIRARTETNAAAQVIPTPRAPAFVESPLAVPRKPARRSRRFALIAGGLLALTIAIATIGRAALDDRPLLAVGWVDNRAGGESDETARLLPGLLATDLARVDGLEVLSDTRIYEVLSQLGATTENAQVISEAARRAGADELLQGTLYRRGNELRLDLRRVNLRTGVMRESYTVEGRDAFDLIDRLTPTIARAFGLEPPASTTEAGTRSLAARRLYEQGLRVYYRGDFRGAHDLFISALGEDSTFAMAALYAATSRSVYEPLQSLPEFEQALRFAHLAPDRDRLLIKARTQGSDRAIALAAADTLLARFPREPDAHLISAQLKVASGQFLDAVAPAMRVLALDSLSLRGSAACRACDAYGVLYDAYVSLDSFAAAVRIMRERTVRQPHSALAWLHLSALLEDDEEARDALARAEKIQPDVGGPYTRATRAIHGGDYSTADRLLRDMLRLAPDDASSLWYLAISARNQGRMQDALRLVQQYRRLVPDAPGSKLADAQVHLELGRFREAALKFDSISHYGMQSHSLVTPGHAARHMSWTHVHAANAFIASGDTATGKSIGDSIAAIARLSTYGRDWHLPDHVQGLMWKARGQPARAAEAFKDAIFSPVLGFTRTNFELARTLLDLNRPQDAIAPLQSALRGPIEASALYVTRTELHELLAKSFDLTNQRDSARVYYQEVAAAWASGDPPFRARAEAARKRLLELR